MQKREQGRVAQTNCLGDEDAWFARVRDHNLILLRDHVGR